MKKNTIIASCITALVLTMLLLAGPAQAFVINLIDFNNVNPEKGTVVSTNIELKILSNERMGLLNPAKVYIDNVSSCSFNITDEQTTCDNIIIKRLSTLESSKGYGYGYGANYGYGYQNGYSNTVLNFSLALNTTDLSTGTHNIKITLDVGGEHVYSSEVKTITIKDKVIENTIIVSNSGSSYKGTCLTNWTCSDWSPCNNGTQIRTCVKAKSYCYAKPLNLTQNCNKLLLDDLSSSGIEQNDTVLNTDNTSNGFFSRLSSFFGNIWNWIFNKH